MTAVNEVAAPTGTITRIQWLALASAFLGWLFDSMDLNLFTLVLFPSVASSQSSPVRAEIARIGGYIIAIKLLCWGIGGILFGVVADRIGRTRTMVITIVIYAVFTGLSGLAQIWAQLAVLAGDRRIRHRRRMGRGRRADRRKLAGEAPGTRHAGHADGVCFRLLRWLRSTI